MSFYSPEIKCSDSHFNTVRIRVFNHGIKNTITEDRCSSLIVKKMLEMGYPHSQKHNNFSGIKSPLFIKKWSESSLKFT